jgi:type III pantothenate kinase
MLLLDAGNSRCKWALVENATWVREGAADNKDWPALRDALSQLAPPRLLHVSNVAGEDMARHLRELGEMWSCPVQFAVAQKQQCGVRNSYEQPAQLGSDRWLALVAAWHRVRRACLVVNCGTATTVDALSASGEFLGGLILPGMELMRHSLVSNTAGLGMGAGKLCEFPRNTADAIYSGVMRATIGAIRQQYALLSAQQEVSCIISGGAAPAICPHLDMPYEQVDKLVLHGLYITAQETGV